MPQMITVLVPTRDPGSGLSSLVAGLDAQTVRADAFEVLVADAGSTDGSLDRLHRLSRSRSNLRVLTDATPADALAVATGEHVLVVDQGWRLLPEALEQLVARTGAGGVDVVMGRRRLGRGGYVGPLADGDELAPEASRSEELGEPEEPGGPVLLVRRELLARIWADDGQPGPGWRQRVLAAASSVAAVPDHACAWTPGPELDAGLSVATATATWTGAVLQLDVTVHPAEDADEHVLVLERPDDGEIALLTSATRLPDPAPDRAVDATGAPSVRLTARLDCSQGAAPHEGVYRVRVQRRGQTGGATAVPAVPPAPALLSGWPVLVHAVAGELRVDVGATSTSLLSTLPTDGTVTESAQGSLLQLPLPSLHVDGPGRLAGSLAVGGLALPAEIVAEGAADGRGAELRCYVSGMEGRRRLGTRFGGTPRVVRSNVDLVMSDLGAFRLEPAAAAPPGDQAVAAPPTKKKKKKKKAQRRPPTRLERLRRQVPPWLEPAVRPVAALPPARALYRRLNRSLARR